MKHNFPMEQAPRDNSEIKINYNISAASRHLLDLKNKPAADKKTIAVPRENAKPILFVSVVAFSRAILFLPKKFAGLANTVVAQFGHWKFGQKKSIKPAWPMLFNFAPPEHWSRAMGAFASIAILILLPIKAFGSYENFEILKNDIVSQSFAGYEAIKKRDYNAAGESFAAAKNMIGDVNVVLRGIASAMPGVSDKLSLGKALLVIGEKLSSAASPLQLAMDNFNSEAPLTDKVKFLKEKINLAMPDLLVAAGVFQNLQQSGVPLPAGIGKYGDILKEGTRALAVFQDFSDVVLDLLGDKQFKRYLLVFQNNNEIRPTGGFIGSFAVLDVDRGKIMQMNIPSGGSYDVKGQLKELVISPEPFHLINSAWQFQDSNWFPDFPEAAKKMMWFYEKSGGPSVDGVVAVNASMMEDLLRVIGPVEMPEYGRTITADNFMDETQKIVELEYDKTENKPKQFIADMAPKVLEKLMKIQAGDLSKFAGLMRSAILKKDVQVYIKDTEAEQKVADFGLAGKLRDIADFTDYFMMVDTNIAGQKTDGEIVKNIDHSSEIMRDGTIIDTVKITRRHDGVKGTLFSGVRNVNYLRVYVPAGSELLEASGFVAPPDNLFKPVRDGYLPDEDLTRVEGAAYVDPESGTRINNEFGRTVFGNWIMVDPGKAVTMTLKYRLPKKLMFPPAAESYKFWNFDKNFTVYKMLVEKQAGAKNTFLKSRVTTAFGAPSAIVGEGAAMESGGWQYEAALDRDRYYGVVLERE
jgi:hypothetical protein